MSLKFKLQPSLDLLTDVTITSPADNELLAFDNSSSEWINQTPAEAGLEALFVEILGDTMTGTLQIDVATTTDEALILKTTDDNTTKNIFEVKKSDGTVLTNIDSLGRLLIPANSAYPGSGTQGMWHQSNAGIVIQGSGSSADVRLVNNAGAGGITVNTNGTVIINGDMGLGGGFSFGDTPDFTFHMKDGSNVQALWEGNGVADFIFQDKNGDTDKKTWAMRNDASGGSAELSFGTFNDTFGSINKKFIISYDGNVLVNGFTASTVGLTVKAAASQTANLTNWTDSSDNILNLVEHDGGQVIQQQAATGAPTSSEKHQ